MNTLRFLLPFSLVLVIAWGIGYLIFSNSSRAEATFFESVDPCGYEKEYEDTNDDTHQRASTNFYDNDEKVDITAFANYQIISVYYDTTSMGTNWIQWTSITNPTTTVNPIGSTHVDKVKYTVRKVCREVCNDDSALNFEPVVYGQTVANNDLCEYDQTEYCEDEEALNYKGEAPCQYPEPTPTPEPGEPVEMWSPPDYRPNQCNNSGDATKAPTLQLLGSSGEGCLKWRLSQSDPFDKAYALYGYSQNDLPYGIPDLGTNASVIEFDTCGLQTGNHVWAKVATERGFCPSWSEAVDPVVK